MAEPQRPRPDGSAPAGPLPVEEVEARARRLGITLDRVLEQLYAIAFADIRRVVAWDDGTLTLKASGELLPGDAAAIAEIVASAKDQKIYRVKLHDKTPALALLTRILEKFAKQDEQSRSALVLSTEILSITCMARGDWGSVSTTTRLPSAIPA